MHTQPNLEPRCAVAADRITLNLAFFFKGLWQDIDPSGSQCPVHPYNDDFGGGLWLLIALTFLSERKVSIKSPRPSHIVSTRIERTTSIIRQPYQVNGRSTSSSYNSRCVPVFIIIFNAPIVDDVMSSSYTIQLQSTNHCWDS